MLSYTLKVVAIIKETQDASTICFKQPALKKITYVPGQYITLIVTINNRKYKRPYSLSSAPGIDNTLNITVKRVNHGIVSNHIIDTFKEGTMVEVIEPMGNFVAPKDHSRSDIYLWGAGSGITPLMSILKYALKNNIGTVTLSYCNPNKEQTIFYDQLLALNHDYPNSFFLNLFYTKEVNENSWYGRLNAEQIIQIIKKSPDFLQTTHYVCGPKGLKETVSMTIKSHGLSSTHIFTEDFEHIVSEDELKDIHTQVVKLVKNEKQFNVEVVKGKSILEAGLDLQLDLLYSCQTGACTLCKAKLFSGKVKTIGDISRKGLNDDEYLLCCSYPYTEDVKFKID
ncbi:flavin reductase family protein [Mucilaginibacter paludis]|uniref:Oxidoreductase FAD-binding domain protein n=1 Tax=Mucilaginibacter paludis DSM 18603 TaxID=714943 RepID=H1XZP4_9SPHI|nr:iron-sulfur cluster-binding domain-containing protein [Mucilaginibacter paludis]EHQ27736.1 Oxidoreductase FAD-binding domain protein [Mucilaginibacter paludis DSM 18603]